MNTIDTILKIAKVKDMNSFYDKYPSEEAFMKVHGKAFKKAMRGAKIKKAQDGFNVSGKLTGNMNDWFDNQHIGLSQEDQLKLSPTQTTPFQKMDFMSGNMQTSANDNGVGDAISSFNPIAGGIIRGIQQLQDEKEKMLEAKQWEGVTDVQLQASGLTPERINRRYVRPEDMTITGDEMFPTYGTGSNVLAKDGIHIKPSKRGTFTKAAKKRGKGVQEFASQVLANKKNYSPAMVKKANFARNFGGKKKANTGAFLENIDTEALNNISRTISGGDSGGATIGGAVGEGISYIPGVGPIVGKLAKPVLTAAGNILDPYPEKTEAHLRRIGSNVGNMAAQAGVHGMHNIFSGSMEDGGRIENIQPNLPVYTQQELMPMPSMYDKTRTFNKEGTTYFDEAQRINNELETLKSKKKLSTKDKSQINKLKSLKDDLLHDQVNTMEKGGKVTGMEVGGDLQLLEGDARSVSNNPYSGETVQFEGRPHEKGGMDIAYGNNPVEVEGGEQATEFKKMKSIGTENLFTPDLDTKTLDPMQTEDDSLVVYGDLPAPGYKGKKFKNVAKDISKKEEKQSKIIDKAKEELETIDIQTPFDELRAETFKTNMEGATMKQKELAQEKEHLASLQEAINQTADDMNVDPSALAKGKVRKTKKSNNTAKYGSKVKAQDGKWMNLIKKHFPEDQWENAYNVMMGESGGNPSIPSQFNERGTEDSHGLFQINLKAHPQMKGKVTDPEENVKYAAQLYKSQGWKPWYNVATKLGLLGDKSIEAIPESEQSSVPNLDVNDNELLRMMYPNERESWYKNPYIGGVAPAPAKPTSSIGKWARNWSRFTPGRAKLGMAGLAGLAAYNIFSGDEGKPSSEGQPTNRQSTVPNSGGPYPPPEIERRMPTSRFSDPNWIYNNYAIRNNDINPKEVELEDIPAEDRIDDVELSPMSSETNLYDPNVTRGGGTGNKDNNDNNKGLWDALTSVMPYFRPSDVEGLNPMQISGELAALSDKPEPVWAQTMQPDLSTPYEVSLQDQKNEIISQSRAAQRMAGNNPAAQAMIASQTSEALNKIQGEEFRFNQAMKDKVYGENRNLQNQTKYKNLQILDDLYTKQAKAKTTTKDTLRNALNSISDKYLKNRFENKTLATYENLYDYRFDDRGRAQYMGRPANFNTEGSSDGYASQSYGDDRVVRYERDPKTGRERIVGSRQRRKDEKVSRNGSIVRSLKRI